MTLRTALIDTVHLVLVPVHAPDQPVKREPLATETVSVTEVPLT